MGLRAFPHHARSHGRGQQPHGLQCEWKDIGARGSDVRDLFLRQQHQPRPLN